MISDRYKWLREARQLSGNGNNKLQIRKKKKIMLGVDLNALGAWECVARKRRERDQKSVSISRV